MDEQDLKPLDIFKECPPCPEMIVVPAGEFIMGSPENEQGSEENERPQHTVIIAKPLAVGRFAVTFDGLLIATPVCVCALSTKIRARSVGFVAATPASLTTWPFVFV